eukprot:328276-Alexandrium_andersonii.AAC.1
MRVPVWLCCGGGAGSPLRSRLGGRARLGSAHLALVASWAAPRADGRAPGRRSDCLALRVD